MKRIARESQHIADSNVFKRIDRWSFERKQKFAGVYEIGLTLEEQDERWDRFQNRTQKFWSAWGIFILVLTILGVEKTIEYNELSPRNDLSQPGQMIPFVLGIITIIEGMANACMPTESKETGGGDSNTAISFIEVDTESQAEGHRTKDLEAHEARFRELKEKQKEECET
jgi:hypothetical protein